MKTISGHCVSVKDISVSKAAKILSKFVSADNGASHVINAYLHRASASFNELNQLHKELESSHSHKKHKRHKTETDNDSGRIVENSVRSVDINQELSLGHEKSNEFKRQRTGSGNADRDDAKSPQTTVKFSQELDGSIGYQTENVVGSETHKKKKKKKQEVESLHDRDSTVKFGEREADGKLPNGAQNEFESAREQGNEGDINPGTEEGRKQKSAKKKHKVSTSSFASYKGEDENVGGENVLCNGVEGENGGLGGSLDLQIKKKKKYEKGSENKLYAEGVKLEQSKNRKSDDAEGRPEDRTGDLTKKKRKKKHSDDI